MIPAMSSTVHVSLPMDDLLESGDCKRQPGGQTDFSLCYIVAK